MSFNFSVDILFVYCDLTTFLITKRESFLIVLIQSISTQFLIIAVFDYVHVQSSKDLKWFLCCKYSMATSRHFHWFHLINHVVRTSVYSILHIHANVKHISLQTRLVETLKSALKKSKVLHILWEKASHK